MQIRLIIYCSLFIKLSVIGTSNNSISKVCQIETHKMVSLSV